MSSTAIRDEVASVGKHSAVYVVGQALSRAVGFFMIPLYTAYISPDRYGAMDLIEILSGIAALVVALGVGESMARFYYAQQDEDARNTVVSTVIIGFAALGVPITLVLIAFSEHITGIFFEGQRYVMLLRISLMATWFGLLVQIGYSYLRMRYMAKRFVVLTTVQLVIALALNVYLIVFLGWGILAVFFSSLVSQGTVGLFLTVTILSKVGRRVSPTVLWQLIRFGLPLVPARIATMLAFVSNRFFLIWFGPANPELALAQVGIFSLGHRFALVVNRFVNVPFNSFWGPRRLELVVEETAETRETIARICTYATFCIVFAALLLCCGIRSVVQIIADPRYHDAYQVVPFIALAYVGLGIEPHLTTSILHRGKTWWLSSIGVLSLGVAVLWSVLFIPYWGIYGAATANVAAVAVREVLIYIVAQRLYPLPFELKRLVLMPIVAVAVYSASLMIHFPSPYLTLLACLAFASLYPFVLLFLGFFRSDELRFLGRICRRGGVLVQRALANQ